MYETVSNPKGTAGVTHPPFSLGWKQFRDTEIEFYMIKSFSPHKLYGLVGNPVAHSLSPNMHNVAFGKLNINAAYLPILVEKTKLKEAISSLQETGVLGFNVTIPFKTECMQYLDKIDPLAKMIGAVNTVSVKNKKLIGSNTDYAGFLRSLREDLQFSPRDKNIFVLGSGGGQGCCLCSRE